MVDLYKCKISTHNSTNPSTPTVNISSNIMQSDRLHEWMSKSVKHMVRHLVC